MRTMLRHLLHLTWLEAKIFVREPLGVFGSVAVPVLLFLVVGRIAVGSSDARAVQDAAPGDVAFLRTDLPVFVTVLMTLNAVLSLVTIIAIYREGGILKRLRATPVRPPTILLAHVLVKLIFTAATLGPPGAGGPPLLPGRRRRAAGRVHGPRSCSAPGVSCPSDSSSPAWSRPPGSRSRSARCCSTR